MPNKEFYVQAAENDTTGMSALMKVLGNTKTFSSAFTVWSLKALSVAMGTAVVAGLTSVMAFAPRMGPVLPLLVGSTAGFAGAMWHRWFWDKQEALFALEEFPELMGHHIMLLGPATFNNIKMQDCHDILQDWKKDADQSLYKQSIAIAALYGASDMIARIRAEREEQLFRTYTQSYAE